MASKRRTARRTDEPSTLPPAAQRHAVMASDGTVMRPARIERAEWSDPDDMDPGNMASARTRKARQIDGFRRVSVLANLHKRSPSEITKAHVEAGERFTRDFEVGHEGARSAGGGGHTDSSAPGWPTHQQLAALTRYRQAIEALGPTLSGIVVAVVLSNWTIEQVAERLKTSPHRAVGRFAASMDRLCDFYWPEGYKAPERRTVAEMA